jgi:adenylate kinase family enzyme
VTVSGRPVDTLMAVKRILVLGPCGSGKTRLTREFSHILDLPAVHLDAEFWRPAWISTPQQEWRGMVSSLIEQESWIMDGTYESTLDLRIPAADAIVVLDRPRWSCLWGVISRSLTYRNKPRPDAPSNQPLDLAYLRYIWGYPARTGTLVRELIDKHGAQIPVIRLDKRKNVGALLTALRAAQQAAG